MKRSIWSEEYKTLRVLLREIRKKADLTQKQLAEILDKPRTYVTKYETADRNLDFVEVVKVCEACNIDPVRFLEEFISRY